MAKSRRSSRFRRRIGANAAFFASKLCKFVKLTPVMHPPPMRRNKPEWWTALGVLIALGAAGLALPNAPQAVTGGPLSAGDTGWMLTAAGLVLLMTPGL